MTQLLLKSNKNDVVMCYMLFLISCCFMGDKFLLVFADDPIFCLVYGNPSAGSNMNLMKWWGTDDNKNIYYCMWQPCRWNFRILFFLSLNAYKSFGLFSVFNKIFVRTTSNITNCIIYHLVQRFDCVFIKRLNQYNIVNSYNDLLQVTMIASGTDHLLLLTHQGQVYSCGCGEQGQLGRLPERGATRNCRKGLSE